MLYYIHAAAVEWQRGGDAIKNTVIFDLDGLLIDTEIISYQLYCDLLKDYSQHMSMEEYIHDYSGKTAVDNMKRLIDVYHLPISVEEGFTFEITLEQEYLKKGVDLKKGARELLVYLRERNYKIILASSSTRDRAVGILSRNGADGFFDGMVFGTEVKRGKPYPDIFIKAYECAKEPPENCLVLEDSEAGIQAAYSAGLDVICIPDMKVPEEEFRNMAEAELSSLDKVIGWLEKQQETEK